MRARLAALRLDGTVLVPALLLITLGLAAIYSAKLDEDAGSLVVRQLLFVLAGSLGGWLLARLGVLKLSRHAFELYALGLLVLLVMPWLLTPDRHGTVRWVPLPLGFKLQPSEFVKLSLVLVLARHLQHAGVTNTLRSYLGPLLLTVLPWFLIMRQPDLGSSLVLLPVLLAMVVVSGARPRHVVLVALMAGVLAPAAYFVPGVLKPYQKERIDAYFASPSALLEDVQEKYAEGDSEGARASRRELIKLRRGANFQQFNSIMAVGSGGLTGAGWTHGVQNRADQLPHRHTDFIFAVVGEEFGLAGGVLVLLLHGALAAAILGVAYRTREPFGRLVCVGVATLVGGQAMINVAIATGMLPVTGLTLPLVSYGGSSMLASLLALACVLDISRRRVDVFFEQ
ncbi:MAG: rod shape-determining protein RodA [Planctomycetota bacterium]|nr:MAG: rod shape-determining protein RodA [Planctomycetota bacterium]